MFFLSSISKFLYIHNTIIFLFVLDTSGCHLSRGFRCICFLDTSGLSFKMYPTMTRAGKDFDGGALGRGLLFMINFPRGSNFPTENTSAQLIPTTKQYLCTRVMSGITGTSVSSPQQITPWRESRIRDFGYLSVAPGRSITDIQLG